MNKLKKIIISLVLLLTFFGGAKTLLGMSAQAADLQSCNPGEGGGGGGSCG